METSYYFMFVLISVENIRKKVAKIDARLSLCKDEHHSQGVGGYTGCFMLFFYIRLL